MDLKEHNMRWLRENASHVLSPSQVEAISSVLPDAPPADRGDDATAGVPNRAVADSADALLTEVVAFVRSYVVLTPSQAVILALWVLHTYAIAAADATPYIYISSPEKRSGKTRLLEVLELIVFDPWLTGRTTVASLVRKVAKDGATLLLDETDAAFKGDGNYGEALRQILNIGYARSGKSSLCLPEGRGYDVAGLHVFGPKALAGLEGHLPDTVLDRSIQIRLKRRTNREHVDRFRRRRADARAQPLRAALAAWSATAVDDLRDRHVDLPEALSDRAQDVAEALLAIADLAGSGWPDKARSAIVQLMCNDEVEDVSVRVTLLADILAIFAELGDETIRSVDLVLRLVQREESPWTVSSGGKAITPTGVAQLLKPFQIRPRLVRKGEDVFRGYERGQFDDAFARYLPQPRRPAVTAVTTQKTSSILTIGSAVTAQDVTDSDGSEVSDCHFDVTAVTGVDPGAGDGSAHVGAHDEDVLDIIDDFDGVLAWAKRARQVR